LRSENKNSGENKNNEIRPASRDQTTHEPRGQWAAKCHQAAR